MLSSAASVLQVS